MATEKTAFNAKTLSLNLADTNENDLLKGRSGNDVLSARNGNDRLRGRQGDDILISYSDSGEPAVLGKQVVNQNEPLAASNDRLTGGAGADTFTWALEIDAKEQFLKKHTQADGRINGANNALAGENNNSHDHWVEGIGNDVVTDFDLAQGDKILISGHTTENYEIETKGRSYVLNLRSNQGNADQNNPNGAHDGDLLGTIKLRGAAAKYSEAQILGAIASEKKVNYVADGRGVQVFEPDTTANRVGIANGAMRIQAEDMALAGAYKVEKVASASGQEVITLLGGPNDETGTAALQFMGKSGKYDIKLGYYDENDGIGKFEVSKGRGGKEEKIAAFELDQELGSALPNEKTFTTRTISGVNLSRGESLSIMGYENGSPATAEHARLDYIEFVPSDGSEPSDPVPDLPPAPPEVSTDVSGAAMSIADTTGNDNIVGGSQNDVIAARNGNDKLMGEDGDDLLLSYSDAGEPPVLGKQVVNQNEPLKASSDVMTGGKGADTFAWVAEIDAREKFLKKHTQADGRINGANNALAGENNNSHDHWVESVGNDVVTDFNLDEGDKLLIEGHTTETYEIEQQGNDFVLNLRSNQGNADQNNPNGAHDGDLLGSIRLQGAAAKYSEDDIRKSISSAMKVNYVADGRGVQVFEPDTTANQSGTGSGNLRVQAEDMTLSGAYKVEAAAAASGTELISLKGGPNDETGLASFKFEGTAGKYQVKLGYFDENDGVGKLELMQGEDQIAAIDLDQSLGANRATEETLTSYALDDVMVKAGDIFSIAGYENGTPATAEHARVDYIEFIPMGSSSTPLEDAMEPMKANTSIAVSVESELALAAV